jgi:hypothetical protein
MAVRGQDVVDYLMQFRGTPYAWGGNSLSGGIDCSGLLQQGFKKFGVDIARVTYDQINQGRGVGMNDLQVGDAVFFDTDRSTGGPDHVGIYIGGGKFLHAPKTGDVVKVSDMTDSYYSSRFMGGRRFDGVEGGGPANTDWETQTVVEKKLSSEELSAQYGLAFSFLNSEPSLKGLFDQAVSETMTPDKFQAKLRETDFWKNNSDTARKALETKQADPATWSAAMLANSQRIRDMAAEMGAAVPDGVIPSLSEQIEMLGMDDGAIKKILADYVDFTNNTLSGQAGMFELGMRQYASDMGVSIGQQAIKNHAQLMLKGMSTQQDFKNWINEQAASAFPAFGEQIKSGQTVKSIANPYVQTMAQSLELNPEEIGLRDPTIMSGLNGLDKDGKPVGKTLTEFQDLLRGDPRWRQTKQAQDKTMSIGRGILKDWGVISA